MPCERFKDLDPFNDVVKIWEGKRARERSKILWPEKRWTENVDLLELMGDGEYIVNGDPFAKLPRDRKRKQQG